MSDVDYPACIRELYESEIFGETISLAVVEAALNERDRYHFGTLLQLETETKARLRPFLYKYEISLSEKMDLPDIEQMVADYRDGGFEKFMAANVPIVQSFLERFQQIAEASPEEDREICESMVRHEASILKWMELEQHGADDSSLDDIIAQLGHPLPTP